MTRLLTDTVRDVMDEMVHRGWRYLPDGPDDHWKTVGEFEVDDGNDCEDFAFYLIVQTGFRDPDARLRMIAGEVYTPRRFGDETLYQVTGHAWVALVDGVELWCDPTPGWPKMIASPTQWPRKALWGRNYEPARLAFTDRFAYGDAS